ncbi:hypothetical protein DFH08DRAFT_1076895 [Mycena albidolilacea]|uniref:Uncharacterized protein n=1 Tax=Mycena albidolilacea TaxID=1033008 RepID=A0AAD7ADT7_9AGAR|nr:hypothetical protein DFH08DRAFT_1076895 [Mycena albidolilacea]
MLTTWLAAIALLSYVVADSETVTSILIPDQFNSLAGAIHGDILGVAQEPDSVVSTAPVHISHTQVAQCGKGVLCASFQATLVEGADYLYYTYTVALHNPLIDTALSSLAGDIEACVFVKSFHARLRPRHHLALGTPVEIQIVETGAPAQSASALSAQPGLSSSFPSTTVPAPSTSPPSSTAPSLVSRRQTLYTYEARTSLYRALLFLSIHHSFSIPILVSAIQYGTILAATLPLHPCAFPRLQEKAPRRPHRQVSLRSSLQPAADPTKDDWALTHSFGIPSGETRLQAVPSELLAAEEKQALHTVIGEEDERERRMGSIEQEISADFRATSSTGHTDSITRNDQMLEEIRMLRNQIDTIQQQQQEIQAVISPGLPEYTPR